MQTTTDTDIMNWLQTYLSVWYKQKNKVKHKNSVHSYKNLIPIVYINLIRGQKN